MRPLSIVHRLVSGGKLTTITPRGFRPSMRYSIKHKLQYCYSIK